jgi:hypothetical protein
MLGRFAGAERTVKRMSKRDPMGTLRIINIFWTTDID